MAKKINFLYLVGPGEKNEDLRTSLRSLAKNFKVGEFDIFIVGHKPEWVQNVIWIPTVQNFEKDKHYHTSKNLMVACENSEISDDFILMNDDFILLKEINNLEGIKKYRGEIKDHIIKLYEDCSNSFYLKVFTKNLPLLQELSGEHNPKSYELHIPIIINKAKYLKLFNDEKVKNFIESNDVILKRSLYGNIYCKYEDCMEDVKIRLKADKDNFESEWISVFDNVIGNYKQHPKFNKFLDTEFPNKCIYEV